MTKQASEVHRGIRADARCGVHFNYYFCEGVCEEMCAQGIQLRFLPTISFLGHMMEQNNPHFMMDCDEQYEIPGI